MTALKMKSLTEEGKTSEKKPGSSDRRSSLRVVVIVRVKGDGTIPKGEMEKRGRFDRSDPTGAFLPKKREEIIIPKLLSGWQRVVLIFPLEKEKQEMKREISSHVMIIR